MIIENITRMGTAILGDIKSVMSGTARIEKPKPVNPCSIAAMIKIIEPYNMKFILDYVQHPIMQINHLHKMFKTPINEFF